MNRAGISAILALVVTCMSVACSSEGDSTAQAEPAVESDRAALQGAFRPTSTGTRGIDEIRFQDDTYRLLANGCQTDACAETGRFTHDDVKKTLTLAPRSGAPYSLRFEVGAIRQPTDTGLVSTKAVAVTTEPVQLIERTNVKLIESASLEGREYTVYDRDTDVCDESGIWPRVWEGMCNGRGYHGIAHCYVKSDECSSSARSCLDDNTGGKRWDQRAAHCSELGGQGFESLGSGISVTQVCCKR